LLTTWLLLFIPLGIAGVVVGEIALPHLLAAQSSHTLLLARIVVLTLVFTFVADLMYGVMGGDQDFVFFYLIQTAQPVLVTISYVVLWRCGALTVTTAVASNAATSILITAVLCVRIVGRHGLAAPSLAVTRRTLWYGIRAHSMSTANVINTRLDLLIIPAFIAASSVGLYSIATNISWIVVTASGGVAGMAFPRAAARGLDGRDTVLKSLYATLLIASVIALLLAAVTTSAVPIIYGSAFVGSLGPLRILLIGAVFYACGATVWAGLYALNRPFTAALSQFAGAAVTVVGLLLFLRTGGIQAAAIVSSVTYAFIFILALALYRRAADLRWRDMLVRPSLISVWIHDARRGLLGRR
jgi:O-antigen/teichoic acid export membrane protein